MTLRLTLTTLVFFQASLVVSAGTNDTINTGWVADPDGRGTFTILSSCVLTLSLCVYAAIHLNVRPCGQTELQSWIETAKWVVLGVLGPELLVFVAWRQYMSAMALDRIVREVKQGKDGNQDEEHQKVKKEAASLIPSNFSWPL